MRFKRLSDWLVYQENLSSKTIELGLDRVEEVLNRMRLNSSWATIVTVAGTNGKGSCVAMLSSIMVQAGYKVGTYTSPHLLRYNERVCINNSPVDDDSLCEAFSQVEKARHDTKLTYFEFGTLAALAVFAQSDLDVVILEVGLGGRLDAVNAISPDIALITNIGIDHQQWLGHDRNSIGKEKAGILRSGKPVVCGDYEPPNSVLEATKDLSCPAYFVNNDFSYEKYDEVWQWQGCGQIVADLPLPALHGDYQLINAACVLMVLKLLKGRHPVTYQAICDGLTSTHLPGRFQIRTGPVTQILDVAHNIDSARQLANALQKMHESGEIHAVVAMLKDKDIEQVLNVMKPVVNHWYLGGLNVPRGADSEFLKTYFAELSAVKFFDTVTQAHSSAMETAIPGDSVVVFGSFYTVAEVLSKAA